MLNTEIKQKSGNEGKNRGLGASLSEEEKKANYIQSVPSHPKVGVSVTLGNRPSERDKRVILYL